MWHICLLPTLLSDDTDYYAVAFSKFSLTHLAHFHQWKPRDFSSQIQCFPLAETLNLFLQKESARRDDAQLMTKKNTRYIALSSNSRSMQETKTIEASNHKCAINNS
jgi:hypothetical protein